MSRRLAAALLVASISLVACKGTPDANATATPVTVQLGPEGIAVAQMTTLASGPILSGTLVADRTAQIRAEVPGSVLQVLRDPGAVVAAGTSLAKIDDRAISDVFLSARSGLAAAEAAADLAARELARAEKLGAAGAIAERDLENARRADLVAKTAQYDARARLAQAQKQVDATNVLAPYAGIVSERFVNPGDVVAPGAPLFVVVDPATMKLEAAIPAEQLATVRVGAPVRFAVTGYPGRTFEGRIASINPAADPQTRQVRLSVKIPNAGNRLVAGLFAEGRVAANARETLTLPAAAIDQRGLSPAVLRLRGGVTEKVEVTLGARDQATDRLEITKGLAAGDTVLVGAALGIAPGTPLQVRAAGDSTPRRN
ncbi:MAG: efflux RND transporter periplasmic adaptor subunit [Gemmatimonadota bacterium]